MLRLTGLEVIQHLRASESAERKSVVTVIQYIELAERGAALDEVHALRSYVFNKQGGSAEVQQEMREAKSINLQVTQIEESNRSDLIA